MNLLKKQTLFKLKDACDRIIKRYYVIREEYEKKSKKEDKVQELTKIDKKKSLKIR